MKFTLEIELGNESMQYFGDLGTVMLHLARHFNFRATRVISPDGFPIKDVNGNTVGKWEVLAE